MDDHDLLIRLDTKFDDFKTSMKELTVSLNEKFANVFAELKNKADKHDLHEVRTEINGLDNRLQKVEDVQDAKEVKSDVWKGIRAMGLKGWGIFVGAAGILFWLFEQITK